MPGDRFSRLYVQTSVLTQDSDRARYRIAALFRESLFNDHIEQLAAYISREIGVPVFGHNGHSSHWSQFICKCRTLDFLDTVTLVYRYLFWHVDEEVARWWRDVVRQIFAEEHLAYQIDDVCGAHPAIDQEFQRNLISTVAALQSHRYQNIRQLIETASTHLYADSPNYKQAWRAILSAVEGLFELIFPHARLSADEIERRLLPMVQGAYEPDSVAQKAARAILIGFQEWLGAALMYRHQPGVADASQPPADIAILAISHGASLLRWLADLDESRPERVEWRHCEASLPRVPEPVQTACSSNGGALPEPQPFQTAGPVRERQLRHSRAGDPARARLAD
jgi:hypothetical protein